MTAAATLGGIGTPEWETQKRVIDLLRGELGYRYLGDWHFREKNSNIDEGLLTAWLAGRGHTKAQIDAALHLLRKEAADAHRSLYDNNKVVYSLLRYGVPVKTEVGQNTETVHLIDWSEPTANDFAVAEEVTLRRNLERRPDLVLYVNGLAVCVIELKNSRVSIGDGIRQLISNQRPDFHAWFFTTVQLVIAGSDSEGLQYGTIGTEEKYFLKWREDEEDNSRYKLDKYLLKLCAKPRLIELMHDFILFDGGVKKVPRAHQYFGVKKAQEHVRARLGGIIWHTQGSGKSLVMVLLAKWILENRPQARVVIVTDRDELDKQIEGVFIEAGESIERATSGQELMQKLANPLPRLLCSLVHKFGRKDTDNYERFIQELKTQPSRAVGELFVFVDECHRTQSGKLHGIMKALLPNAVFIGFTGTPLLKSDKTSVEVFGRYIDTYKFGEAVRDKVVLDLLYEARNIDQTLGASEEIDAWFDAKTRGLNDWQRAALREQWGTMQTVLSSASRMDRVVKNIVYDFGTKPRLSSERGTAILVAGSIYEACKYFELFQKTIFRGKCGVVTSYNFNTKDTSVEDTGANSQTDRQFIYDTYSSLLKDVVPQGQMSREETYEERAKELFKKQPANMKLLIVVDKLLTGFDAPSCTYLYIDKKMQDHRLFQAVCRTNRLDGDDKQFGYIVDYKDLFKSVEDAIAIYSAEQLDHNAPGAEPEVLMQDRLAKGRQQLDEALEAVALLNEPVQPPRGELEHIHYYCGNSELPEELEERIPRRVALYKAAAHLLRSYAAIADEMERAGYTEVEAIAVKDKVDRTIKLREIVRNAAGEKIELKAYEADMRHLIDTYIEAAAPKKISPFDNMPLLDLIVSTGIADAVNSLPEGIRSNQTAVAETIANNVRSKIIKERLNDPAFYDKMSLLLAEVINDLQARRIDYQQYLNRVAEIAASVQAGKNDDTPASLTTPALRALYNNLGEDEPLALAVDAEVRRVKPADFRGHMPKERVIKQALLPLLNNDVAEVEHIFLIIKAQDEY